MELIAEKWSGAVSVVKIGAAKDEGGTRSNVITVGGEAALPFLPAEGALPNKPATAHEIWDITPPDWPEELNKAYKNVFADPVAWAQKCVKEDKARLLCVRLQGAHPDFGDKKPEDEAKLIGRLLKEVDVPLIILGCQDDAKDNLVLPACCEAAKGERCLVGSAVQDNYKTLTAAVLADGHNIIAESPIDINIAKQLNILISDMGLPLERIIIDPTIGALGYGLEYAYSIMERARLAGLSGDKMMACPFICLVGQEAWRAKEAKAPVSQFPAWGAEAERGVAWEIVTATALIQAGADILVMRHPKAIEKINKYIDSLF
ncbi:MAG: acetyl-CoA decarbonylase/synthase complex subunit delta [Candidatus Omnitrophica bacterium]|nr:acetyl-CoA decarbonylase/synthase complex subunit delta [Candidatus Omnitrophota bacterium]MDD5553151.1 acetyl-CoA decarbonylase/synthase complex subunit delta [Candidatus Omnitrophota bacterium]